MTARFVFTQKSRKTMKLFFVISVSPVITYIAMASAHLLSLISTFVMLAFGWKKNNFNRTTKIADLTARFAIPAKIFP